MNNNKSGKIKTSFRCDRVKGVIAQWYRRWAHQTGTSDEIRIRYGVVGGGIVVRR